MSPLFFTELLKTTNPSASVPQPTISVSIHIKLKFATVLVCV